MKLYNDYNTYLRNKYGVKVYRIGIDAGFTCPNRDGSKGHGGCLYCNDSGSRAAYTGRNINVQEQLQRRIDYLKKEKGITKFIAYFQAFTNTHASPDILKPLYDNVLRYGDIVGMSIGTRPDAVDRAKLKLISSYKNRFEVWLEYGLQSANDESLELLKRGHTYQDFVNAVSLASEFNIHVSAHVIIGIPGETKAEIVETAKRLTELKIEGVKVHSLHILKGSKLEELYLKGNVRLLEQDKYASLVADFLENLPPDVIIQRLTGQGSKEDHVAPAWALDKAGTIGKIEDELIRRGTWQGFRLQPKFSSHPL